MTNVVDQIIADTKRGQIIPIDGGTGSMLEKLGIKAQYPALVPEGRDALRHIAREYARAGARVVTSGTWRTKETDIKHDDAAARRRLSREATLHGIDAAFIGVQQAKGSKALVLGSVSPLGDCYQHENFSRQRFQDIHGPHLETLAKSGVKVVAFETFTGRDEAKIVADLAREQGLRHIVTWVARGDKLLDGTPIGQAAKFVANSHTIGLGINCSSLEDTKIAVPALRKDYGGIIVVKPNGPEFRGEDVALNAGDKANSHASHAAGVIELVKLGANWAGGCCGTVTPHIAETARAISVHQKAPAAEIPAVLRTAAIAVPAFRATGGETNLRLFAAPFRGAACDCHPVGPLLARKCD